MEEYLMTNNDSLVLNEMSEAEDNLRPSIQIEQALAEIKDTYKTLPLAKIPFAEITALGGSFAAAAKANSVQFSAIDPCIPKVIIKSCVQLFFFRHYISLISSVSKIVFRLHSAECFSRRLPTKPPYKCGNYIKSILSQRMFPFASRYSSST